MSAAIAELLGYLTPDERAEVDFYTEALITGQPHTEYQADPIGWAADKLGIDPLTLRWSLNPGYESHTWDGTPDPMAAMCEAIADGQDATCEAGTGTQKSFTAAILILWFLACFEDSESYTFAPTADQLKLYIWKNITGLWPRFQAHFPNATLTELTIRMRGGIDERWSAHGRAVALRAGEDIATRAAGMHAEHMLLVYEETPGIDWSVMIAGKNTCTAPHNLRLAIGNPNHQLDSLHRMSTESGVVAIRASALDHPNVVTGNASVIPGAASAVSIRKRLEDYGETSPVYHSRVRGLSPAQASDALIRLEWLERARARFLARKMAGTLPTVVTGKGVDVANSEHGDRACIADFAENALIRLEATQCPNAGLLGAQVALEMKGMADYLVGVDTIGVGASTYNELLRIGKRVQRMVASRKPITRSQKAPNGESYEWAADGNVFRHQRDQWYWQFREDLRTDQLDLDYDAQLWEEALAPTFVDEPQTIILAKDDIKALLGRSPDKLDAVVMGNWVRHRSVKRERTIPGKEPHRAVPLTVKDGKLVKGVRPARTIDELVEQMERRSPSRLPHRERLPRRTYG